jgi:hypothetical protein
MLSSKTTLFTGAAFDSGNEANSNRQGRIRGKNCGGQIDGTGMSAEYTRILSALHPPKS